VKIFFQKFRKKITDFYFSSVFFYRLKDAKNSQKNFQGSPARPRGGVRGGPPRNAHFCARVRAKGRQELFFSPQGATLAPKGAPRAPTWAPRAPKGRQEKFFLAKIFSSASLKIFLTEKIFLDARLALSGRLAPQYS